MKKLLLTIIVSSLGLGACAQTLTQDPDDFAGSGFPRTFKNPYLARTARHVGDIVTIVVSETSQASFSAATNASKKDSNTVAPATLPFLSALKIPLIDQLIGGLFTGADSSISGSGSTTSSGRFQTRMSVVVKEVLPNGNMVVEGVRWVKVNKEEQNITFTGIVRRDDVRADNTVLSENVADARITSHSKGVIAERQRKGIITRLLDWLF